MPGKHSLHALCLVFGTLTLACCGGGGSQSASPPGAAYGIALNNLEIATQLYLDVQRTPAGFLADPPPPGAGVVATHHLQSGELAMPVPASYEVCSNDWNEALAWSEATAAPGGSYASLVGTSDTSRYFEFDRTQPGTPAVFLRQRVYQCSYLDRSDSSAAVASGPAGVLNVQPRDSAAMRELSEYLWHFTSWNNFGSAVLASVADSSAADLGHTLVVATLARDAVSAGCDRVAVLRWRHSLDTTTGALQRSLTTLWSFSSRQSGNAAVGCGS
jgi:hypothetical protein